MLGLKEVWEHKDTSMLWFYPIEFPVLQASGGGHGVPPLMNQALPALRKFPVHA